LHDTKHTTTAYKLQEYTVSWGTRGTKAAQSVDDDDDDDLEDAKVWAVITKTYYDNDLTW